MLNSKKKLLIIYLTSFLFCFVLIFVNSFSSRHISTYSNVTVAGTRNTYTSISFRDSNTLSIRVIDEYSKSNQYIYKKVELENGTPLNSSYFVKKDRFYNLSSIICPKFENEKFYAYINKNYEILNEEPSDWNDKFSSYYYKGVSYYICSSTDKIDDNYEYYIRKQEKINYKQNETRTAYKYTIVDGKIFLDVSSKKIYYYFSNNYYGFGENLLVDNDYSLNESEEENLVPIENNMFGEYTYKDIKLTNLIYSYKYISGEESSTNKYKSIKYYNNKAIIIDLYLIICDLIFGFKLVEAFSKKEKKDKEYYQIRKRKYLIYSFAFGFIGVNQFYLKHNVKGVLSVLFFWTLIPFFVNCIEGVCAIFVPIDELNK